MAKLVNEFNVDNLGEKPENFMDSFQKVIYEAKIVELQQRELNWKYLDWKAEQDSRFFSKISHILISAWEIAKLIAGLRPGQYLVVNSSGEIHRGYVNTEKLQKLPYKIPQHKPSNMDDAQFTYKNLVSKSVAEPATVAGFKIQWGNATRKAAKSAGHPLLSLFMEVYDKKSSENPDDVSLEITHTPRDGNITIASIKGFSVRVCTNQFGRLLWYEGSDKIRHEVNK